jgi:hypothetical protein
MRVVEDLWGGELPVFDTIDEANELIAALVAGLWNRLTRHQDRNSPFRLMRIETAPTREGLAALALIRRQELDGFVAGLFGREDAIDLPERAHRGLDMVGEMRALLTRKKSIVNQRVWGLSRQTIFGLTKAAFRLTISSYRGREGWVIRPALVERDLEYGRDKPELVLSQGRRHARKHDATGQHGTTCLSSWASG